MKIGSNFYEFNNSIILAQRVRVIPLVTVAVTLGCFAYEDRGILLCLFALLLNILHFITYTLYLKKNFKFAVTKNGLLVVHGKAYTVPWQLIAISQKEATLNDIAISLNIANNNCTDNMDKDSQKEYVFFRSKSYVITKQYGFEWRKKLADSKQNKNIKHFMKWKQRSMSLGNDDNEISIIKTNLILHIIFINFMITALIYAGGIMLAIVL